MHELRRRLFYVVVSVLLGAGVAYGLERKLISVLLRPSHGQNFIYTSPLGGINFLFSVCLDIGLVLATPIIIYQLLAFLSPIMKDTTRRFLLGSSAAAGIVAVCGVAFGYFIGLPSALHFLLHQFTTLQIRPLITIQSYISFVALYLFGSALMFQLPLILFIINRIKPLKPSGLFKYERHLIAGAFIVAFIMNPTPNIIDQMVVVVPIIIMYQLGIGLIWLVNRGQKPSFVQELMEQDAQRQAERAQRQLQPFDAAEPGFLEDEPEVTYTADTPAPAPEPSVVAPPRQYPAGMQPQPRRSFVPLRGGQLVQ
ncbi:MAG: twin-arginine translocase subunit TatC [Candidatus Saccharibacteria bacterium]